MKWNKGIDCKLCKEDFLNVNELVWHYMHVHNVDPQEPTPKPRGSIRF